MDLSFSPDYTKSQRMENNYPEAIINLHQSPTGIPPNA